jgi:hypothetical protein
MVFSFSPSTNNTLLAHLADNNTCLKKDDYEKTYHCICHVANDPFFGLCKRGY